MKILNFSFFPSLSQVCVCSSAVVWLGKTDRSEHECSGCGSLRLHPFWHTSTNNTQVLRNSYSLHHYCVIIIVICVTWPGRCMSVTLKGIVHIEMSFKTSMFFNGMQRLMSRFCEMDRDWTTIMFVGIQSFTQKTWLFMLEYNISDSILISYTDQLFLNWKRSRGLTVSFFVRLCDSVGVEADYWEQDDFG